MFNAEPERHLGRSWHTGRVLPVILLLVASIADDVTGQ
jgi:hypothetical protein